MTKTPGKVRVAAVGDLHLAATDYGPPLRTLFGRGGRAGRRAGAVRRPHRPRRPRRGPRAGAGARRSRRCRSSRCSATTTTSRARSAEVSKILCDAGVHVLDGEAHEVLGIGFAGVKGFAGGFGRRALGPWGETSIKQFVQEALDEALKLETALGRLRTERRMAVLHYSPIEAPSRASRWRSTPTWARSRLEEPLTRYPVDVVFHGHAHHGSAEGRTMQRRAGLQRVDGAATAELPDGRRSGCWTWRSSGALAPT